MAPKIVFCSHQMERVDRDTTTGILPMISEIIFWESMSLGWVRLPEETLPYRCVDCYANEYTMKFICNK